MVTMDKLHGVQDHSAFLGALTELADKDKPAGVIVLDIDTFAEINRVGGREAGDQVIVGIASVVAEFASEVGGSAYRVSGDEFCLLLPEATLEQAFLHAERLRKWISENQAAVNSPKGMKVTVSAGVSQFPRDGKTPEDVLRTASAAMFAAKESGRDQVSLPMSEEMVMKSCYYPAVSLSLLKQLAARLGKTESVLLREALDNLLRKYDD